MLTLPVSTRVFLALGATDMRKSFDTLAQAVREVIGEDPLCGHIPVFCNQARNRLKILHWDGSGFWLYAKRLERGTFAWRGRLAAGERSLEMSGRELPALLGGEDLRHARLRLWYQRWPGTRAAEHARHVVYRPQLVGHKTWLRLKPPCSPAG